MKRIILVAMVFLIFTSFMNLNAQWARAYGGFSTEHAYSIQQTNDGGYIIAGETHSFGAGDQDFWVLKLSSIGAIEWQRTYGGNSWEWPHSIQQTSDGGYVVAGITYSFGAGNVDFWVLKLSSIGTMEWQHTYGGSEDDWARSIQQTSDGGYIVAGGTCSFGFVWEEIWILKLYSDGAIEWQKTYGGSRNDSAYSVQQTSDGGYIVAGETQSYVAGNTDIWILKLYSDGAIEWQRTYGGSRYNSAHSIQQTSDEGYVVAGNTDSFGAGDYDIWVLKLNSDGTIIEWQHSYGGSGNDSAYSIQQTSDGGYVVAGNTDSFGAGIEDIWILKLNPDGTTIEWQHSYGGSNNERAYSIQQTSDEGYIVAGQTYSFEAINAGPGDFLILKLYSDGDIDSSCELIGSSNATITDTSSFVLPENTDILPQHTDVIPLDTICSIQDTDATFYTICGQPILTISATTGGTTDPSPGTYTHDSGIQVSVQAIPNSGYQFSGWSGDVSGMTNPITITMDSDKSVIANFEAIPPLPKPPDENGKKGGCFIATAAYGSPLHPHIDILREFRDKCLMPTKLGRMLVGFYYKNSPFFADLIAKHKALKVVARINLLPFVVFSYLLSHFSEGN